MTARKPYTSPKLQRLEKHQLEALSDKVKILLTALHDDDTLVLADELHTPTKKGLKTP